MHVNVGADGQIEVNEHETTLDSLKLLLAKQKADGKGIFYTRRPADGAPTPEQWIVFVTVSGMMLLAEPARKTPIVITAP